MFSWNQWNRHKHRHRHRHKHRDLKIQLSFTKSTDTYRDGNVNADLSDINLRDKLFGGGSVSGEDGGAVSVGVPVENKIFISNNFLLS